MQTYTIKDAPSATSSRRHRGAPSHHSGRSHHHRRRRRSHYEQDLHSATSRPESYYAAPQMVRRHTHHDMSLRDPQSRPMTGRSKSDAYIDMDLAYGDAHPSTLARQAQQPQQIEEKELKGLVSRAQWLLEEANCMQHTATETISHLQKNPDAMAAVALTLAEISNLATKMAPAALSALKASAPAVWALLASPQFLVAAGVGLGATVVAFGGYKIIKRIKSSKGNESGKSRSMEDMVELDTECLTHVEKWRRGVADAEAESSGTSVEGEFITPTAAAMSRLDVNSRHHRSSSWDGSSAPSSRRSRRTRSHRAPSTMDGKSESRGGSRAVESVTPSKTTSKTFTRQSKAPSKTDSHSSDKDKKKPKEKKKGPSRLRQMFTPS